MFQSSPEFILIGSAIMWPFPSPAADAQTGSAYDFHFSTLIGNRPLPLAQYRGKVLLIVNTASKCGFTPQYQGLQALYDAYRARGLVIVGVPSNDFGGQEPGTNETIAHFCQVDYGVAFPMTAKVRVKGDEAHPFYRWARECFGIVGAPKWNFHKYLIDRNGHLVDYFHSTTGPTSPRLRQAIDTLLAA